MSVQHLAEWRDQRQNECGMTADQIPWADGRSWTYDGHRLGHVTGRFFSIVGVRATSNRLDLNGTSQPIIDQPEVGVLGMLSRHGSSGLELLMQAKAEPGNPNLVQLAPTVQATASNYTRVHGGAATEYLDHFTQDGLGKVVSDTSQSEQGTRFLGKYNRNALALVDGPGPEPASNLWRWSRVEDVLQALLRPYMVNTDARSVLATTDWGFLSGGTPFARTDDPFAEHLGASYAAPRTAEPQAALNRWREATELTVEDVGLDSLPGWTHDGWATTDSSSISVPMMRVVGPDREVSTWDQPMLRSLEDGQASLLCQAREGVLRFRLDASHEMGFAEKVQFGPTLGPLPKGTVVASSRQSDEGGRFDRSATDYSLVMLDDEAEDTSDSVWATLGEVEELLAVPGTCNNELRSAISLLLAWL